MKPLESLYQDALIALNNGRLPDAERLFKEFLKKEPNHVGALNLLTVVLMKLERFAEAEKYIAAAVKLNQSSDASFHNYGLISKQLGKLEQARDQFSKALQINGSAFETWSSRGAVSNSLREFERAIADFDKAILLNPNYPEAYYNKGRSLHELKRYDEALAAYEKALALKPDMAEAWVGRGNVFLALNRHGDAAGCYERALSFKPNLPEAWLGQGRVFIFQKRYDEALACFDKCFSLKRDMPAAWVARGNALAELRRYDEAFAAYDRALSLDTGMADAWLGRGVAFVRISRYEEALAAFDKAIEKNPELVWSHVNKGDALRELGRFEESEETYRKALTIDPGVPAIYARLLNSRKVTPDDPHMATLEALAEKLDPSSSMNHATIGFALGKAHADMGHHRQAFEQWIKANALMRQLVDYDDAESSRQFERIEQVFSRELIAEKGGQGDPRSTPIFILGMPRSGTTLVEQILSSHPMVYGAGELTLVGDLLNNVRGGTGEQYPDFVRGLDGPAIRRFAAGYLDAISGRAPDAAVHVTDKMPGNFNFIGMIHLAFPNARIIHTMRDPVDNCVSCFSLRFTDGHHYTYDLAELGRYYRRYESLMAHWHRVLPPGRILDVRYEDVVADVEGQARRLLAHCGLEWDPRCLAFHETKRPIRTASLAQVRQPIYASSVGRWRVYEEFLGPLLAELGVENPEPAA